jgi:hypothetical protein
MSRPEPIKFTLHNWTIEYESEYFESDRTGTYHYMAHITWSASVPGKKEPVRHTEQKIFTNSEDAKKWVEKEISV